MSNATGKKSEYSKYVAEIMLRSSDFYSSFFANCRSKDYQIFSSVENRASVFIGEPEDIPDKKFGLFLPNRRVYAKAYLKFIGYIIRFDPELITDKKAMRKTLGYGEDTLIVCSIGGTSIGKGLLELCKVAYPNLKSAIPNLQMIMVTGPRLDPGSIDVESGIEVKGFVPVLCCM